MAVSITLNDDRSEKIRYNYPGYPVYMREALLSQYPEYRAPSHWHDDIEFICVLSGGMKYNINGEIVNLKKGEGIFVNSGQMHSGFSDNGQECGFLCLLFHPMLLCSVFPYENDFVTPLIQNSRMPYLLLCPSDSAARRQLFCRNISQKDGDKPHGVPQAGSVNRFELHRAREL